VRRRQQRLAEVTELIHVASLLHDDVLDNAATRRGLRALNIEMGNKLAILAGDFLLARASVTLASLRDADVIMLLSTVIEHLVTGEVMQSTARPEELLSFDFYTRKTHFKTASLIAKSCKAVALLGGQPAEVAEHAYEYGRHLGLAFQYVDDVLDFTGTALALGKPALSDLRSGIATGPLLWVQDSTGVQQTRDLATQHAASARESLARMPQPQSEHAAAARDALVELTHIVLRRTK
jgi:geranyl diphosphate synthase